MGYVFYHIWIHDKLNEEFLDWVKSHYGTGSDNLVIDYSWEGSDSDD